MRFLLNPFSRRLDAFEAQVGPGADVELLTGDAGGAVGPNGAGNITILGTPDLDFVGTPGTNSFAVTDLVKLTPYVVDAVAGTAPYQTIQAAITAIEAAGGSGTIYIRPGVYTENLAFAAADNIGLRAINGDEDAPVVEIVGVHVPPTTGNVVFWRIKMTSATHIFSSAAAGSGSVTLVHNNYSVNGYIWNLPNWTGTIACGLIADSLSTASGIVNNTGGASVFLFQSSLGVGNAFPMIVSGFTEIETINVGCPVQTQGSAEVRFFGSNFSDNITLGGSTFGFLNFNYHNSGANQAITYDSSGNTLLGNAIINSSNNPSIGGTGIGILTMSVVSYLSDSNIATTVTTGNSTVTESGSYYSQEFSLDRGNQHLKATATTSTVGAVTADILTLSLGATAGVYILNGDIVGFNSTDGAGGAYFLSAAARTTGVAATEIASEVTEDFEEAAMIASDVTFLVSGNNAIVRVQGIAGKTISWRLIYEYSLTT